MHDVCKYKNEGQMQVDSKCITRFFELDNFVLFWGPLEIVHFL